MIRVLIVDDQASVRTALAALLAGVGDVEVAGTASSGREAVELAATTRADVVLMDISMPDVDGIRATRELRVRAPNAQVVMLTASSDPGRVRAAIDAGAIGYLLKDEEPQNLVRHIRAAANHESPVDPKVARHLLGRQTATDHDLTPREREILALVAEGLPNKVIARRLDIAEKTVKHHVGRILQTLGVSSRTDAAIWARSQGLSPDGDG